MMWRLYMFIALMLLGLSSSFLGGYLVNNPKYNLISVLLFFFAIDTLLLSLIFAQEDGATRVKNNRSTE